MGIQTENYGNFKLKEGEIRLDIRDKVFTGRVVRHWDESPEQLWLAQPWRCSKPVWMGL